MADRRVERRNFQVGTGMMNDPERLDEIAHQLQQSELNHRLPPKTKFSEVLAAPPPAAPPLETQTAALERKCCAQARLHPAQQNGGLRHRYRG